MPLKVNVNIFPIWFAVIIEFVQNSCNNIKEMSRSLINHYVIITILHGSLNTKRVNICIYLLHNASSVMWRKTFFYIWPLMCLLTFTGLKNSVARYRVYSPETLDLVGNIPISTYSVSSDIPFLKPACACDVSRLFKSKSISYTYCTAHISAGLKRIKPVWM